MMLISTMKLFVKFDFLNTSLWVQNKIIKICILTLDAVKYTMSISKPPNDILEIYKNI